MNNFYPQNKIRATPVCFTYDVIVVFILMYSLLFRVGYCLSITKQL